jgi:hypothetical protein
MADLVMANLVEVPSCGGGRLPVPVKQNDHPEGSTLVNPAPAASNHTDG